MMKITHKNEVKHSLKPSSHPYLSGAWTPNFTEYTACDMEVIGEIPTDIDGVYVRNTENPVQEPIGHYHPFDADGMIHAMSFRDGKAEYSNRFVRTKGFVAEQEAGEALWAGFINDHKMSKRPGVGAQGSSKDGSSTDVVVHAGKIISTFWQCGDGYQLDPYTLEQLGTVSWAPIDGISAHPKVDEKTGEMLFFNYSRYPPYQHYGVVNRDGKLVHFTPVPLPGPRLPHDMAFSENYSIFADLPLFWDPLLLEDNIHFPCYYPELPSRFSIIPRFGNEKDIVQFEAKPTYVLHWLNAYEEGDEVILEGYFQENPNPGPIPGLPKGAGKLMAQLALNHLQPKLYRWRFNLVTGEVVEGRLDDRDLEFGTFNQQYAGQKSRFVYSVWGEPDMFIFSGIVKHDTQTGESWSLPFGEQRFGSEAPFVPRINAKDEDDGYLVTFITDMNENRSECVLIDARDLEAGALCRIVLPHRISSGTHATWADGPTIRSYQK
ncbi:MULTISPECIES: carotenoid oxygenase family protein [unclassified Endozoicomonas]|uniref:carotenoid oxygenase family protein n=1 Tax=unclassified Endozoicomonas TaxID=2644528 RepID=UPI003BB51AEE